MASQKHILWTLVFSISVMMLAGCTGWNLFTREPKEVFSYYDTLEQAWVDVMTAPEWMEKYYVEGEFPNEATRYVIQKGVSLQIEIEGEPSLTRSIFVGPDGTFDFPMIGETQVAGFTVPEFKQHMREKLQQYIRNPVILVNATVVGTEANSIETGHIYILGESGGGFRSVRGPRGGTTANVGGSVLGYSGYETFIDVITSIGGPGNNADWNAIGVIRKRPNDKPLVILVDYEKIIKYADFSQDIPILPNDIIYIPRRTDYIGNKFAKDWGLVLSYMGDVLTLDGFHQKVSDGLFDTKK